VIGLKVRQDRSIIQLPINHQSLELHDQSGWRGSVPGVALYVSSGDESMRDTLLH
jgi:hypothetical protein